MSRSTKNGINLVRLKSKKGRGRKISAFVESIHQDIRDELELLTALGDKFSLSTLNHLSIYILHPVKMVDIPVIF